MKRKHLMTFLSLVLVAVISIGATLAYLTDEDSDTNTFTVGNIDILLDEADVDEAGDLIYQTDENGEFILDDNGNKIPNPRVHENEYHLIPGHEYIKDPTVTVKANSEDSYIRMLIKVENIDKLEAALPKETAPEYYGTDNVFLLQKLVTGWDSETWIYKGYTLNSEDVKDETTGATATVKTGVYEFRYKEVVEKTDADRPLDALFDTIIVPGEIDNAHLAYLKDVKIIATAQAIQADGFENADAAWGEFPTTPN